MCTLKHAIRTKEKNVAQELAEMHQRQCFAKDLLFNALLLLGIHGQQYRKSIANLAFSNWKKEIGGGYDYVFRRFFEPFNLIPETTEIKKFIEDKAP